MCQFYPNDNLFHAIFEDRKGRIWLSREVKPVEEWSPKTTGLRWEVAGAKPWDNSEFVLIGLRAKCECLFCCIRCGWFEANSRQKVNKLSIDRVDKI